ncbi:ATP-binding cassette domain-containing protein [Lentibacillus cibarius]|uniref:ATP-binding cassette domain-containing protein n=1 Tax=Lentibacillus cibarius TaxID=2583219 RepID=A0A5S3QG73_9BACI|nr:ATP-binding cassette domain-containing protein [Lentibacillus cibarius]TMN20895.1 ATP-binding cassette domain-containing protein [Lentibacillus cibarius]
MIFTLKDINVCIGKEKILHNITCSIPRGRWISVIGTSGSGKSTLLKTLKGLVTIDSGEYFFDDRQIVRKKSIGTTFISEVGYVFQYPEHQFFQTTVYKELALGLKQKKYSKKKINDTISEILQLFDLSEEFLAKSPFQLSGGQRRKLAIASVMTTKPKIMLLDEPTAALDPISRKKIVAGIKRWQEEGNTVIFVSHQMEDVAEYSDSVIVMQRGRIVTHMDATALFLHYGNLMEESGMILPPSVQLKDCVEKLTKEYVDITSCREADILAAVRKVVAKRGAQFV